MNLLRFCVEFRVHVGGKSVIQRRGKATNCAKSITTIYPFVQKASNPENLLKKKGLKSDFSPPNPDNVLKKIQLHSTRRKLNTGCKMPDRGDAILSLADGKKSPGKLRSSG